MLPPLGLYFSYGRVPVPLSATDWLVPGAETLTLRTAVLGPAVVGLKVTVRVQKVPGWSAFAPPVRQLPRFLANWPEFVPASVKLPKMTGSGAYGS